ncbi:MAG: hypothetical protein HRU69_07735 [Flammeovirgaceae bacterium]|nr:MAG: hypothetical protein HRU69_07735 [Flammeovirgaceae bacterium]
MNEILSLKNLEDWFEDLWNIIADLHISLNNLLRLKEERYPYEEHIKKHGFFQHHWYQLKFILIVQLAKLFSSSSSQKRSFHRLFNRLIKSKYGNDIVLLLKSNNKKELSNCFKSRQEIILAIEELRSEIGKFSKSIKKVIDARDKVYAHRDSNITVEAVSDDDLKALVELSAYIFNTVRRKFLNTTALFSFTSDWNIDFVLREVSQNRENKLRLLAKKERN